MPGGHGRTRGLRMNETEHRQMLRQWPCTRKEGFETDVCHRRSHALGNKAVKGCTPGLALQNSEDSGHCKPQLPFVRHGGQPAEEVVVFASGETRNGLNKGAVQTRNPSGPPPQHPSHFPTLQPKARCGFEWHRWSVRHGAEAGTPTESRAQHHHRLMVRMNQ